MLPSVHRERERETERERREGRSRGFRERRDGRDRMERTDSDVIRRIDQRSDGGRKEGWMKDRHEEGKGRKRNRPGEKTHVRRDKGEHRRE